MTSSNTQHLRHPPDSTLSLRPASDGVTVVIRRRPDGRTRKPVPRACATCGKTIAGDQIIVIRKHWSVAGAYSRTTSAGHTVRSRVVAYSCRSCLKFDEDFSRDPLPSFTCLDDK